MLQCQDNNIFALDEGNSHCSAKLYKLKLSDNNLEEQTFFDTNKLVNKIFDFIFDNIDMKTITF